MKRFLFCLLTLVIISISGCGVKESGILDEISGVWGIQGESGLFSIIYKDKKISLLANDDAIPVTLGDIDNENKTVNLNVTLQDGKPGIWTLRQIWDKDNKSYHLQFTFHDGAQANLSFVRKISTDDLNKIANTEARNQSSIATAANATKQAQALQEEEPVAEQSAEILDTTSSTPVASQDVVEEEPETTTQALSPSFDCSKASTFAERAICTDSLLGKLDGALSYNYKSMLASNIDEVASSHLKTTQKEWLVERNNCTSNECLVETYRKRVDDVCEQTVISGVIGSCLDSIDIK